MKVKARIIKKKINNNLHFFVLEVKRAGLFDVFHKWVPLSLFVLEQQLYNVQPVKYWSENREDMEKTLNELHAVLGLEVVS